MRADPRAAAARDLAALDRRGFLRLASLAAAAGLLPGCGEAPPGLEPPPGVALDALTPRTYAVLNAAAERVVGPRGGALVADRTLDPARAADAFLGDAPRLAPPLRQALLLLEWGMPPLVAKWRPFTALDAPGRDAVLRDLAGSRLATKRRMFAGLRSVALLGFYGALAEAPGARHPIGRIPPGATIAAAMSYDAGEP